MTTTLTFHGAAGTVTGSCFRLDTANGSVLVDCGLFQGPKTLRELNYGRFPFEPARIDAVLLTHAHIDHAGLLPKLVKHGYQGSIHATPPTIDLSTVMLPDAAYIQETEVERINRRDRRKGRADLEPIYTVEDAQRTIERMRPVDLRTWIEPIPGVRARYWNAGHLLGSASIEVEVSNGAAAPLRLLFSGDVGPRHKLLQPGPEGPADVDYLLCESTFGATDRIDFTKEGRRALLAKSVNAARSRGGALIVPTFAVERAQEIIADLYVLMREGAIPHVPVFLDSPLAQKASEVFRRHADDLDNPEALIAALSSPDVRLSTSVEDSKAIGRLKGFFIVMAASGMCEAGRIRHHLKEHLWRRDATVLLVGYQAVGTLGRLLLDGAKMVRIMGTDVRVEATIDLINAYSGHADAPELVEWISQRLPVKRTLFLVHGEEPNLTALKERIAPDLVPESVVVLPQMDETFDLEGAHARALPATHRPRIAPEQAARLDWHNDLTRLLLDINEEIEKAPDERTRQIILRRLRRALEEA
ncbi:MAG: MBL fold metallo-hydrolase [Hyphomicrobiales bacterium]